MEGSSKNWSARGRHINEGPFLVASATLCKARCHSRATGPQAGRATAWGWPAAERGSWRQNLRVIMVIEMMIIIVIIISAAHRHTKGRLLVIIISCWWGACVEQWAHS